MKAYPKVAIVYLSYHSEPYTDDVVSALEKMTYPKDKVELVIVDNPHPTMGSSVGHIHEKILPLSGSSIPHVTLIANESNIGFSAGMNAGINWALKNGFDYVYLHNNDGFMASTCIEKMVDAMEADKSIGVAQSLLLLYPETDLVNSAGNAFHYLGFGYVTRFRAKKDIVKLNTVEEVGYASGASLMMRAGLLKEFGNWMEEFFLYHEDLEYSLRLKAVGYKPVIVSDAIFYHKYQFSRSKDKFYYMERNRFALLLMYLKWPTLILFLPIALIMELGLLFYSFMNGIGNARINVYRYWLQIKNWKFWLGKRKQIQAIRKVRDRELLKNACSKIVFEEKSINNPLVKYIANPLMSAYWWLVKRIILW